MRQLLKLIVGSAVIWLLVVLPLRAFTSDEAETFRITAYSATAFLLCLLPMAGTLLWGQHVSEGSPEQQMLLFFGGTGLRIFSVLLGGWALAQVVPFYRHQSFWLWLAAAYCCTLAIEVTLMVMDRSASAATPGPQLETSAPKQDSR
jgi:hypothetical protein